MERPTGLKGYAERFDGDDGDEGDDGYLDFARYRPPSRDVLDATARALAASARAGHDTVDGPMRAEPLARDAAARLAGTDVEHVVPPPYLDACSTPRSASPPARSPSRRRTSRPTTRFTVRTSAQPDAWPRTPAPPPPSPWTPRAASLPAAAGRSPA